MDINPAERQERAEQFFMEGYNCCQAVLLAFQDILPVDRSALLRVASGFGGGIARMREVCGTVSAMAMIAGFLSPAEDPSNLQQRRDNYALVQRFAQAFKEQKGSIVCREILGLRKPEPGAPMESPMPSARTPEYYKTRPCAATVGIAARIVADYIKDEYIR
ncbi:MAG: C_GCAxxG_C_C family protein [Bacteroidales bacterium]|nr:C_GCAxxG_C_C family protein [Bacteroidales bacterium]